MFTSLRRLLLYRRCSIRFWFYRRPLVSVVCLATVIVCVQLILMSMLNSDNSKAGGGGGGMQGLNKVARVAQLPRKRIPTHGQGKILGVLEELQENYRPDEDGNFKCLFSEEIIDFDRVNDDYCDCEDGSDEPSTSACPDFHFFCLSGTKIPSSRVNDGICDCCDGTDEYQKNAVIGSVSRDRQEKIGHYVSPCINTCPFAN